jgi:hypothetical protein
MPQYALYGEMADIVVGFKAAEEVAKTFMAKTIRENQKSAKAFKD